jgi:hypothetical protein
LKKIKYDDAQEWLNQNYEVYHGFIIKDQNRENEYRLADLLVEFANDMDEERREKCSNEINKKSTRQN